MESLKFKLNVCIILTVLWFKIGSVKAIINGLNATEGQFPYLVSVQVNKEHVCGGAIISKNHILTAAHCIINYENYFDNAEFTVVAGITTLDADDNHPHKIIAKVDKIYMPKKFKFSDHLLNDICVLKLQRALELGANRAVNKLNLPLMTAANSDILSNYNNAELVFAGFGADTFEVYNDIFGNRYAEPGENSNQLKYSKTKVFSKVWCMFKSIMILKSSIMCAHLEQPDGSHPRGICRGDSGGPLVLNNSIVIGVLSMGPANCNEKRLPGLYTRVTNFLNFIEKTVRNEVSSDIRVINKTL